MIEKRLCSGIEIKFPLIFFLKDKFTEEKKDFRNPLCVCRMMASDSDAVKLHHLIPEATETKPTPILPRTSSEEELYKKCQENLISVSDFFYLPIVIFFLHGKNITNLV